MTRPATALIRVAFWVSLFSVVVLSLLPTEQLPPQVSLVWDKAQHAAGFAGLAVLGLTGYPASFKQVCFGLLLTGAFIELAQHLSGWRHGDLVDLFADLVGIVVGTGIWMGAKHLNR
ncbi:VanZ family protein [Hydrogenophaga palleronii]|uniref:VanZ family protein n=1 Tax=Hydrogenophaga palleronii TaxID=65655 RepID=A0ABU1WKH8_9BURK|nr:VanZ family protein [Hydrogenophaga palleronii]MDR7149506.1 VanZ family protein [Hydrogenophaga palleronii]